MTREAKERGEECPDYIMEMVARAFPTRTARVNPVPAEFIDARLCRAFYITIQIDNYLPDYVVRLAFAHRYGKGSLTDVDLQHYGKDRDTFAELLTDALHPSFAAVHVEYKPDPDGATSLWYWQGVAVVGSGNNDKVRAKTLMNRIKKNVIRALRSCELTDPQRASIAEPHVYVNSAPDNRTELEKQIRFSPVLTGDVHVITTDEVEENPDELLRLIATGKGDVANLLDRLPVDFRIKKFGQVKNALALRAEYVERNKRIDRKTLIFVCVAPDLVEHSAGAWKTSFARYLLHCLLHLRPADVYEPNPRRPFDDYSTQPALFFDEYNPANYDSYIDIILRVTDPFNVRPVLAPARYSDRAVIAHVVLFCTPLALDDCCSLMSRNGQEPAMIRRRIKRAFELNRDETGAFVWRSFAFDERGENRTEIKDEGHSERYIREWADWQRQQADARPTDND